MQHQSDPRILNERTLERDHRRLAELLRPGMRVLDVGCGTGSITQGIAAAVGANGFVLGIDRDAGLLAQARPASNLAFEAVDIRDYAAAEPFDIVTAARVIQWIAPPLPALEGMVRAAKPGGLVVVLDYNHDSHQWAPEPSPPFQRFYGAFLAWREANGWSNRIADEMPELFRQAGLLEIGSRNEAESDFERVAALWVHMTESIGPTLVNAGFLEEEDRQAARQLWGVEKGCEASLALRSVIGRAQTF